MIKQWSEYKDSHKVHKVLLANTMEKLNRDISYELFLSLIQRQGLFCNIRVDLLPEHRDAKKKKKKKDSW